MRPILILFSDKKDKGQKKKLKRLFQGNKKNQNKQDALDDNEPGIDGTGSYVINDGKTNNGGSCPKSG